MAHSRQRAAFLGALAGLLGACSLLNAPEDLKPAGGGQGGDAAGGQSGNDGGGASGRSGSGGKESQAGASGAGMGGAGEDAGSSGLGSSGSAGEAGATGCTDGVQDCPRTAPVCDPREHSCRGCLNNDECLDTPRQTRCLPSGRCGECLNDKDCSAEAPVCGPLGLCRGCTQNDECSSGICDASAGTCKPSSTAVYALAVTGVSASTCGDLETPCSQLSVAAGKLSAARPNLVLVAGSRPFNAGEAILPAIRGLHVIGNGVQVAPYDGASSFVVSGGSVSFEGVDLRSAQTATRPALSCTGATLGVKDSHFEGNALALGATDCDVTVSSSVFLGNAAPLASGYVALSAGCALEPCTHTLAIERSRFEGNGKALYSSADTLIQNSLFLRNGDNGNAGAYNRVLEFRGKAKVSYSTFVENFNTCSYVGLLACDSMDCEAVGNITFNNFFKQDCPDQVFYSFDRMSYNLTETLYPGAGNLTGDPLFVSAATGDYTPGKGSRAIDNGNPLDTPKTDYAGKLRPLGAAPDIGAIEAR